MNEFNTPFMKQYKEIKKQYTDCLLFYRMGDFYELFLEDAHIGSQVLNITLTSKPAGKDVRVPMAGIPYHAVDTYVAKLVKAGHKVAICEQVSLPNKYGIIDREVVRIVTPGTVLDEKALEKKENNYIVCLTIKDEKYAISAADISTGYFAAMQQSSTNIKQAIQDELFRLNPSECILSEELYNNPEVLKILKQIPNLNIFCFAEWNTLAASAKQVLKKHFGVITLSAYDVEHKELSLQTSAVLLGYLQDTQKNTVAHIKNITSLATEEHVVLDRSTIINLELFSTIREHDTRGSLLHVLDHTITPMGGRLLKQWLKKPLIDKELINQRHEAVQSLLDNYDQRLMLEESLKEIADIERILSRLSVHIGNARDLRNLSESLKMMLIVKDILQGRHVGLPLLQQLANNISSDINKVIDLIETHIVNEPPIDVKQGGIIKPTINKQLDTLRNVVANSKTWILEMERQEKEKTGITSLKVRFNKVFGFYIEVSKSYLHLVPKHYMRKQTLVNGERFITEALKQHEQIILQAEDEINALEYEIFSEVLSQVLSYTEQLQAAAQSIASIDCLVSFASVSEKNNYVRPTIVFSGDLQIKQGRHPVVEKLLEAENQFVPNDVILDNSQQLLLITGPNMAGKSVFIRQVAIIVLMNQIGCFVPAQKAELSIVDRIFVRSGASDVITSGLSTFMVEMVETAYILNNATKNSLIIMDEIGRGTSTYDGISIAWAVAEYLVTHFSLPPKTLFATHYHELQALEEQYPKRIKNYHLEVINQNGQPIFLHTILQGGASYSFGVAVAKLAGIPDHVITKANEILQNLEKRHVDEDDYKPKSTHYELQTSNIIDHLIHKELDAIDIAQLTPLEAINKLAEIKEKLKTFQTQQHALKID